VSFLARHMILVKDQLEFHRRMAERYADNPFRSNLHKSTKTGFEELAADIMEADKLLDTPPEILAQQSQPVLSPSKAVRLALAPQDIEGLPEDLLKELSVSEGDKTEFAIISIIEDNGGIATLDRLLIGMYKKTGEIYKRQTLTSRLYRMAQKELVYSVPTRKGVYSTRMIAEDEAVRLFSGEANPSE
jgi:hypothetical protein